jgi:hypothetical protein
LATTRTGEQLFVVARRGARFVFGGEAVVVFGPRLEAFDGGAHGHERGAFADFGGRFELVPFAPRPVFGAGHGLPVGGFGFAARFLGFAVCGAAAFEEAFFELRAWVGGEEVSEN